MLCLCCAASTAQAEALTLRLPSFANGSHVFFHRLLSESLRAAGHSVDIEVLAEMPQPRVLSALAAGRVSAYWLLQTPARAQQYVEVAQDLTQGLIGQRVLLVRPSELAHYRRVRTLQDFRALGKVAGMGGAWFDAAVWERAHLPVYRQEGDWRSLFPMIASAARGVDYLPRGAHEAVLDARTHPELVIEPQLLFTYPRDLRLYLAPGQAALKPIIEHALRQAARSGLQQRLLAETYGPALQTLALPQRRRIALALPPQSNGLN